MLSPWLGGGYTKYYEQLSMEYIETWQTIMQRKNIFEIRSMNSTRYFYTVKRNAEGKLIYLVDGLDYGTEDFAYPGTYIEEEMIPYINKALSGKKVYSQDILDTTWGHIFTACYQVKDTDTGEIIGALCIETDVESTYAFIEKCNQKAMRAAVYGSVVVIIILMCSCIYLQMEHKKRDERARELENMTNAALSADRAKSTFLFDMSHDIRTPMNAIIGYLNLARRHLDDREKVIAYMDKIDKCSSSLLSLLNNELDLARIKGDKTETEEVPVNIGDAFRDCVEMFENTAEESGQNLVVSCALSRPQIYMDKTHFPRIRQRLSVSV